MTQLSSQISVEEEDPKVRSIQGLQTSVLACVGVTERGPHEATRLTSFDAYSRTFGGDIADGDVSHAIRAFFDGGGQEAHVKRVVHYTNIDSAVTKLSAQATKDLISAAAAASAGAALGTIVGPFVLVPADTLLVAVDGAGAQTATFNAVAAARASGNGNFALSNGETLLVEIDGGGVQTITFLTGEFASIGAATPAEVAAVINAKITGAQATVASLTVVITSDKKGTASSVDVSGGTANGVLGYTTGAVAGTGNVANSAAVTVTEVKTVVEAAVTGVTVSNVSGAAKITSNTTGPSSSILVQAASTADTAMGFNNATHSGASGSPVSVLTASGKTDGTYAHLISLIVESATNGASGDFNLAVEYDGNIVETYPNLSTAAASTNYSLTVINDAASGSNYISLAELVAATRPANGTYGPMTGGNDGLSGLVDADFTGSSVSKTGIRGFDQTTGLNILIVPGRATPAVHTAMVAYCQTTRQGALFPVLDPPAGLTSAQSVTYFETTAGVVNLSEFGAAYYPRILVLNPSVDVFGSDATIVVPPSGHIAAAYARADNRRTGGVYDPPAGIERGVLVGCLGFENNETTEQANRDLLYPKRINPLRAVGGVRCIDGVRTLKGSGNFPTIAERRGVIFIEQSLKSGLEFARFRNNDKRLRSEVERTIQMFLLEQMRVGAFRSMVPAQAFFVDVSDALNPPSVQFAGKLIVRVGLATQKPAEFIILRISQDTRAIEAELAG